MKKLLVFSFFCSTIIAHAQPFSLSHELFPAEDFIRDVHTADLDGDGFPDLITATHETHMSWYKNDGTGAFESEQVIDDALGFAESVQAEDMDNDGLLDIVVGRSTAENVVWYKNLGGGLFSERLVINMTPNFGQKRTVEIADLNGDGFLDIVSCPIRIGGGPTSLGWNSNNGDGTFSEFIELGAYTVYDYSNVKIVDIDTDGDMDVVLSFQGIRLFENDGSGVFAPVEVVPNLTTAYDFKMADLDGDGDPDFTNGATYNENLGGGVFAEGVLFAPDMGVAESVELGDIDGDGDLDIYTTFNNHNEPDDDITWFANDGSGQFSLANTLLEGSVNGWSPVAPKRIVHLADVDNDADLDFLYLNYNRERIDLAINSGGGTSLGFENILPELFFPAGLAVADLNGDGNEDIIASKGNSHIVWYPANGDGAYAPQLPLGRTSVQNPVIVPEDLDLDGDIDIVLTHGYGGTIVWYRNDGLGNFGPQLIIAESNDAMMQQSLADLDGDGDVDVLAFRGGLDQVVWHENLGDAVFGPRIIIDEEGYNNGQIAATDLDGDGDPDAVFSTTDFNGSVQWMENLGGGAFGPAEILNNEFSFPRDMLTTDKDGDGDQDILLSCQTDLGYSLVWVINQGDGTFDEMEIVCTSVSLISRLHTRDIDGDGDQDAFFSVYFGEENVSWCEHLDNGQHSAPNVLSDVVMTPYDVLTTDIDSDGDFDVLSAIGGDNTVIWFENALGEGCTDAAACNYNPNSFIDNGSCCYTDCGCTDPNAENYDELATCDDNSCSYIYGCMDSTSTAYNPLATIDDGSCLYNLSGVVFYDEDENGDYDALENGLGGHPVVLFPGEEISFTNDQGVFSFNDLPAGLYQLQTDTTELFPFFTTDNQVQLQAGAVEIDSTYFGISDEFPVFNINVQLVAPLSYACDSEFTQHYACVTNTGTVTIEGQIVVTLDSLFQAINAIDPVDSISGYNVYMSYEGLAPGHSECFAFSLHTPTVDFIGSILNSTAVSTAYFEGDSASYGSDQATAHLLCAYDPNDKQVTPAGYSDAHYVPENQDLEYRIRFQNTGNAPATDVIIRDTLDLGFDLSSFQVLGRSHDVITNLNPATREIEFYFQDIQLPDSVNNEPESHGFVSFKIRPEEGLPLLTELNNTAGIYFDNNPPIITNTTWSTLYDCSLFEVSFTQDGAILTASEGDSYQWYLDGEPIDGATAPIFEAFLTGEYAVEISNDFPCSELTSSIFILIDNIDELAHSPISLFPNPMTSSAIIDLGDLRGDFTLEIYNLRGQLMRVGRTLSEAEGPALEIERGNLAKGQYLLRLSNEEQRFELPFAVD